MSMIPTCKDCKKRYTIRTLKKWGGLCKRCYDKYQAADMDIDFIQIPTIGEHRQAWINFYPYSFETVCQLCQKMLIDVFTFQSDYVNNKLMPMCKNCCHPSMRRHHDELNRDVWVTYIGKKCQYNCPIGCHNMINVWNYEKGHVHPEKYGGKKILSNLRPICGACNKSMGVENMESYYNRFQQTQKFSYQNYN